MTPPEQAVPAAPPESPPGRHALTYRPSHDRYEWLRLQAYQQHRPMQAIIDQALDQLRGPAAPTTPEQP